MIWSSLLLVYVFFFFKQKTAYEMRISDWSSDVCSSDLVAPHASEDQHLQQDAGDRDGEEGDGEADEPVAGRLGRLVADIAAQQVHRAMRQVHVAHQAEHQGEAACDQEIEPSQGEAVQEGVHEGLLAADGVLQPFRSEEHTSELQSLMRSSYAVFCL